MHDLDKDVAISVGLRQIGFIYGIFLKHRMTFSIVVGGT